MLSHSRMHPTSTIHFFLYRAYEIVHLHHGIFFLLFLFEPFVTLDWSANARTRKYLAEGLNL